MFKTNEIAHNFEINVSGIACLTIIYMLNVLRWKCYSFLLEYESNNFSS